MNTSTYANVMRVLMPNSSGGWSEKYEVSDPSLRDGIPLSQIFVSGAVAGERFLWEVDQTGNAASKTMEPFYAGPLVPSSPGVAACWHNVYTSTNRMMNGYEVSVVPGMSGKVRVGKQLDSYAQPDAALRGVGRILWPNSGAANNDSNQSESLAVFTSSRFASSNPIYGNNLCVYPEVYGEFPLVVSWQRTPYSESWDGGYPAYDVYQQPVTITGSNQVLAVGASYGSRMRLWVTPGSTGKVYVGKPALNKATLSGVFKVVYPNPSGGHSDGYDLEYPTRGLGLSTAYSPISINGDVAGEIVTQIIEVDRLDPSGWARQWSGESYTAALSTTPLQVMAPANKVSRITFRNIPGQCSKIYLGMAGMNTATLSGVFKILYPNCGGGIGEEYTVSTGASRGIQQNQFYVAADYAVDVLIEVRSELSDSNYVTAPTFVVKAAGPVSGSTPTAATMAIMDTLLQFNLIPGQVGKIRVGGSSFGATVQPDGSFTGVVSVLYPNTGLVSQSNARSESSEFRKSAGVQAITWWFWPEVLGESVLVSRWGY